MSGSRFFLDTNAIIHLLAGNRDLLNILHGAEYIATSVICKIEFLAFSELTEEDRLLFQTFLKRVEVVDLCSENSELIERILSMRVEHRLKLPDAIVAASASINQCTLVTADERLLKVAGIQTVAVTSV